jgi:hypothetical protein
LPDISGASPAASSVGSTSSRPSRWSASPWAWSSSSPT